jgi:hypothetical protein
MSASIIAPLVISGSRKSDGTANASGKVWAYLPDTSTTTPLYSDPEATTIITQPIILDEGGRIPTATAPDGVFTQIQIRLYIEDSDAVVVSDSLFTPATATNVSLDNEGWTGPTEDDAWTALFSSLGGVDGKFQESAGATERTVKDKFAEQGVSVKDFGAEGDGVTIDTTAIQNAINEAKVLQTNVLFPSGEYRIDQALSLSSVNGVSFVGAGVDGTTIVTTSSTANVFTLNTVEGFTISGMTITATGTNSGSAISLTSGDTVVLRDILVDTSGGGTFLIPVVVSGGGVLIIQDCRLTAKDADATARALKLTNTNGVNIRGGFFNGLAGAAMEFAGTTSNVAVMASSFGRVGANIGILWTSGMTGTNFTVVGSNLRTGLGVLSTSFDLSSLATNPIFRQWGNEVDGYATTTATGAAVTPDMSRGSEITITANSGGAGVVTINAAIPGPATTMRGVRLTLKLVNALGGAAAVTWTLNGVYKLVGAVAPAGTDGTTTIVEFLRDVDATVWREVSRSNTTT